MTLKTTPKAGHPISLQTITENIALPIYLHPRHNCSKKPEPKPTKPPRTTSPSRETSVGTAPSLAGRSVSWPWSWPCAGRSRLTDPSTPPTEPTDPTPTGVVFCCLFFVELAQHSKLFMAAGPINLSHCPSSRRWLAGAGLRLRLVLFLLLLVFLGGAAVLA